ANEAQTYLTLDKSLQQNRLFPDPGYSAKMFAFLQPEDIRYYSVATPFTELYFKTTMEQGQSVDALVSVNIKPNLNFSVAYKGLRSLGKYINQLSSTGNFRFTGSYFSKEKRYILNGHFMSFDFLNGENGGLRTVSDFESEDERFKNRARLDVYLRDARSFLKGKRMFIDHVFRINPGEHANNISVFHQLNYETRFYEYNQATVPTTVEGGESFLRFGDAYVTAGINDQARYNKFYNKAGVDFELDIADVGFGISQILPVIVQCFLSKTNSFTVIEQPEIHLHPKMQADLTDLFIEVLGDEKDKCLIVETHSEYLLNRLRLRIAQGKISRDDVAIYFVEPASIE
ncbi:MAG: hypothetical protein EOP04_32710, partial [Proteobacteria bacterium]